MTGHDEKDLSKLSNSLMRPGLQVWIRGQQARYAYRRGLDSVRKGNDKAAIACFTEALEHHPRPAEVYVTRGVTYWQSGDVEKALEDFTQATYRDARLIKAYGNRGLLRYELGDEQGALADWQQALAVRPADAGVRYNRALLFIQKGDYSAALADLNQALEANPNLAEAYYHRGNVRYELGDAEGAVEDWELALCNDLRLGEARDRLQQVQRHSVKAQLSRRLQTALKPHGVKVDVQQSGSRLDIDVRRPKGTGINYFTLPNLIRKKLIDWQLPGVRQFRLTGQVDDQTLPEWQQVYSLYQGQPSPPAHWKLAWSTALMIFPPLGIPALIYAQRVGESYRQGDYPAALQASKTARALCLTGIAITTTITSLGLGYWGVTRLQSLGLGRNEMPKAYLLPSTELKQLPLPAPESGQ